MLVRWPTNRSRTRLIGGCFMRLCIRKSFFCLCCRGAPILPASVVAKRLKPVIRIFIDELEDRALSAMREVTIYNSTLNPVASLKAPTASLASSNLSDRRQAPAQRELLDDPERPLGRFTSGADASPW